MCNFHCHFGEWQWDRHGKGSPNRESAQEREVAKMLRTCTKKTQTSQNLSIHFPDCRFTLDSVFFLFYSIFFTLGHFAFLKTFSGREIGSL